MTKDATVSDETSEVSGEQVSSEESSTDENSTEEAQSDNEEAVSEDESESSAEESFTKVNPDELPDELKPLFKNMQADYTRKTQELKELQEKAQLYDRLVQEDMVKKKFPEPQEQAKPETENYLADALGVSLNDLDDSQRQQVEQLAKIVDAAVNRRVSESIKPIQDDLLSRDYKQELEETRGKYPDFNDYVAEIKKIVEQNPQMSYEQAYKLATYEEATKRGRAEAVKNFEAKKKQSSPKTTPSAKESDEPDGGFESIFNWAKKKTNS